MACLLFSSKHMPFNNRLCDSICPPARRSCAVSDSGFESVGGLHPGTAELSINISFPILAERPANPQVARFPSTLNSFTSGWRAIKDRSPWTPGYTSYFCCRVGNEDSRRDQFVLLTPTALFISRQP